MEKTFAEAVASYVEHGGERRYLDDIVREIGGISLHKIVPFDIKALAKTLFPDHANSSLNRMIITPVSAVVNHAHQRGWGPVIRIRRFQVNRPPPKKAASQGWLHAFVRQCHKDQLPHVAALVLFMSQTGARVSEAIALEWPDVNLSTRTILLRRVKSEANSVRHLSDSLTARLFELRHSSENGSRVFRYTSRYSVNERIAAVCQRADISYKSSHTCGRHAMANNALSLGADIKSTMIAGGWKNVAGFLNTYVNPRDSGRLVADRFNSYQYDSDL